MQGRGDDLRRERVRETGSLLRTLLIERAAYRDRWCQLQRRGPTRGPLNQSAVAKVIAHHLWDSGDRRDSDISLPRVLKDRVSRALAGDILSAETLGWFIDAFRMTAEDTARLRGLRFGRPPAVGSPIVDTLRSAQFVPLPQRHRTLAAFERRIIDGSMHPIAHRTTRALTACEDGVDSYPCRLIPKARDIRLVQGGHDFVVHSFEGSTPVLEIKLNSTLRKGEITSLEYEVEFDHVAPSVETEYRRVAHARVENLSLFVQFHPARPPRRVWRAIWDDYRQGNIIEQHPAPLDRACSTQWFIPYLENAAAGFLWTW